MDGRIVVTGAGGFLGRHLLPILKDRYGADSVVGVGRRDYNLLDPDQVRYLFAELEPASVVHLAAYSGGIGANRRFPADFFYRNTLLTALVFHEAARRGLKKLLYFMGGCSYPADAMSPIEEGQMWHGFPQPESAGYSCAKKMGLVASRCYRQQHGLNSVVLIPGNMYGEYDNFRNEEAHVIPALVRRFWEAKTAGDSHVILWGSGTPLRDFVYTHDVAALVPWFLEHYDSSEPVNVSTGRGTSIRQLAETVRDLIGFRGHIVWNALQPDGQREKVFDVTRLHGLGLNCPTPLAVGLKRTVAWFQKNYANRLDAIRL